MVYSLGITSELVPIIVHIVFVAFSIVQEIVFLFNIAVLAGHFLVQVLTSLIVEPVEGVFIGLVSCENCGNDGRKH